MAMARCHVNYVHIVTAIMYVVQSETALACR